MPFLDLRPDSRTPLYRQLTRQLRQAILANQLKPGQRLPSTRLLMAELRVSRSTVVSAFEQLIAEGYLSGQKGSGTFVRSSLASPLGEQGSRPVGVAHQPSGTRLSERGRTLLSDWTPSNLQPVAPRPFAANLPALDLFPYRTWSRLHNRIMRRPGQHLLNYGEAAGYRPLRRAIAAYLSENRGVSCEAEQVIVTSGTQKAINLVASLLLNPRDRVLVEDPGGRQAREIFAAHGAEVQSAPVDDDGLSLDGIDLSASPPQLIYVTPSCHYPLGMTLPVSRRLELLELAGRSRTWILEDDEDSEFRFVGQPVPAMQGLDSAERVIYLWSFSEVLFPAIRLGGLVVPGDLVEPLATLNGMIDRGSSLLTQALLYEFISEGYFHSHIRAMRSAYAARRQILLEEMQRQLSPILTPKPEPSGLRVVGLLDQAVDDQVLERRAEEQGILSFALSGYCHRRSDLSGLILGFACAPEEAIAPAVARLAQILEGTKEAS